MQGTGTPAETRFPVPLRVSLLAVLLFAIAAAVYVPRAINGDVNVGDWRMLALLTLFFLGCEATQIKLQVRRQVYTVSLSEVALVVGLFALPPLGLVLARVVAGAILFALRRTDLVKSIYNLGIFAAEVAVAVLIFYRLGQLEVLGVATWGATYAAVGISTALGVAAVIVAVSVVQEPPSTSELTRAVAAAGVAAALNITIALVILILLKVTISTLILLVVLAAVLFTGYRAYSEFQSQNKSLSELYEFTRAVTTARQQGALVDTVLTRTRELLNAEAAILWLPAERRYPEIRLTALVDNVGVLDQVAGEMPDTAAIERAVLEGGETIHVGPRVQVDEPDLRAAIDAGTFKDAIAVPLRSGNVVVGCLEVVNRLSDMSNFAGSDVRLLETLAAHAAVAVENSRLLDRLRYDAYHDGLTGLANRRRFLSALDDAIKVDPLPGEAVAVLFYDVDGFRDVNEALGHDTGDRLLTEVAAKLDRHAPDGALVARVGADEFAVLIRVDGVDAAIASAVALQFVLTDSTCVDGLSFDVTTSVGVAAYPDDTSDADGLLQHAEAAQRAAITNPRGVQVYSAALETRSTMRVGLVSDLRRAVEDGSLSVNFQPKVSLTDGTVVGVESLVQWNHPEHGHVAATDIIPVAEHSALIVPLTLDVLRKSLAQLAAWAHEGHRLDLSVNLSPRCLADVDFPVEIAALLTTYGLEPSRLTLEIAETGLSATASRPLAALRSLRDQGIRLSLDDFGTGLSSLSYLRQLPLDEVKIDKQFVLGMATDTGDRAVVRAIVDLAGSLGITAVAEGVETAMTLDLLRDIGCPMAQGYLFSRPLPAERLDAWMAARTAPSTGSGTDAETGADSGNRDRDRLRIVDM